MTVVDIPPGARTAETWLGGRFRLDERVSLDDQVSGFSGSCGSLWEARGLSLWKATDQLLNRPVTIYLLPRGPVPSAVTDAVRSAAKVSDPRLATIYDTDFDEDCPYIVAEWTRGTHLEDLLLSGLPHPALAAAMIADAADAIAVAHRAGRPHLRLTPRSLRWDNGSGLKITGLGLDDALWQHRREPGGGRHDGPGPDAVRAAHRVLAGDEATALARAPARERLHAAPDPRRRARHAGRHRLSRPAGWPPTPRCGRRPRLGWPSRSACCNGRPTSWNGWSGPSSVRRPAGAGPARETAPGSAPRCCARRSSPAVACNQVVVTARIAL
jgi:hypothetical protein